MIELFPNPNRSRLAGGGGEYEEVVGDDGKESDRREFLIRLDRVDDQSFRTCERRQTKNRRGGFDVRKRVSDVRVLDSLMKSGW